ncbi:hypothetical protein [Natronocalculus amylovorans]|nr:hypothetical protein [Natronocalculus amylovorans]
MADNAEKSREAGLKLMVFLGGVAFAIFILGIAVIWILSSGM